MIDAIFDRQQANNYRYRSYILSYVSDKHNIRIWRRDVPTTLGHFLLIFFSPDSKRILRRVRNEKKKKYRGPFVYCAQCVHVRPWQVYFRHTDSRQPINSRTDRGGVSGTTATTTATTTTTTTLIIIITRHDNAMPICHRGTRAWPIAGGRWNSRHVCAISSRPY